MARSKVLPEVGPQSMGQAPILTELRVRAFNRPPNAVCLSYSLSASRPRNGMCSQPAGSIYDISSSFDPDTSEGDAIAGFETIYVRPLTPCHSPSSSHASYAHHLADHNSARSIVASSCGYCARYRQEFGVRVAPLHVVCTCSVLDLVHAVPAEL